MWFIFQVYFLPSLCVILCVCLLISVLPTPRSAMISVFFVLSNIGEVIVFKNLRQEYDRYIADAFVEKIKADGPQKIPPVLVAGNYP